MRSDPLQKLRSDPRDVQEMINEYIGVYERLAAIRHVCKHLFLKPRTFIAICNISCNFRIELDYAFRPPNRPSNLNLDLFT